MWKKWDFIHRGFVLLCGGSVLVPMAKVSIQVLPNIWGGRIFLQTLGEPPVMLNSLEFIPQGQKWFFWEFADEF